MANKKISELPTATAPDGSELMEVVQGGVNKKLTLDDLPGGGGAVDSVNGQTGTVVLDAVDISNTPSGTIAATTVQEAIDELDTEKMSNYPTTDRKTSNYVLVLGDAGKLIESNIASSGTITIPPNSSVAFPLNTTISVSWYGGMQPTLVAGSGVTLRASSGVLTIPSIYSAAILKKIDTDEWYVWNGSPVVFSSTYTPTLSNTTNVNASTAYVTGYYRVGNVVTVFGKVDIDATAAASTATLLGMSLPVASNIAAEEDIGGVAHSNASGATNSIRIIGDSTNDRASFVFLALTTNVDSYSFQFSYQVK